MQPTNINGNWQTEWMGDLAHELDKKERWELKVVSNSHTYIAMTLCRKQK